jgi:hypothetical protein
MACHKGAELHSTYGCRAWMPVTGLGGTVSITNRLMLCDGRGTSFAGDDTVAGSPCPDKRGAY